MFSRYLVRNCQTKMFLNKTENCVRERVEGAALTNPNMCITADQDIFIDRSYLTPGPKKVAIITGGGSGHEPFPSGYIGEGMLAAGVPGAIFTSPPTDVILSAIKAVGHNNEKGVLVVSYNYTGDRINFGLGLEKCKAAGMKVEMFVVGEDCAFTKVEGTAGRRGLVGGLFVFKIAGAMAYNGASLEDILATCEEVAHAYGTLGVAASGCIIPGREEPLFEVDKGILEMGLGLHGEAGCLSIPFGSSREVADKMLTHMTLPNSESRLDLKKGEKVAIIINNLGSVTQIELNVFTKDVITLLRERGVKPVRVYVGSLITSLNMKGLQISILRLTNSKWLPLLDAPTSASAWPKPLIPEEGHELTIEYAKLPSHSEDTKEKMSTKGLMLEGDKAKLFEQCVKFAIQDVVQHEKELNQLDSKCGDGDCGSTLYRGLTGISKVLDKQPFQCPSVVISGFADVALQTMGGASGGLYSLFLIGIANKLQERFDGDPVKRWSEALRKGIESMIKYGKANRGDRTMLDALLPATEALEKCIGQEMTCGQILTKMADAAEAGCEATRHMKAKAGRASYCRPEDVNDVDAGARAVALCLRGLAKGLLL
ncbi:triokinase/FMN cyclase-like isoform X2 [Oratosquilla oratoria]|uniref:triokinase/FMN cyclase-like isoform X2 n=1 Tax=Oratosquilla oratoria TaxID=337810 RepID=UPI003F775DD0